MKPTFSGPLIAEFVDGIGVDGAGVIVIVYEAFTFTDSKGVVWKIPAGLRSDGASIPKSLWSTIGSPFTGPYRRAALPHDAYYQSGERPKGDVDAMFREAMIADGTPHVLALAIFEAVSKFGRHAWDEDALARVTAAHQLSTATLSIIRPAAGAA